MLSPWTRTKDNDLSDIDSTSEDAGIASGGRGGWGEEMKHVEGAPATSEKAQPCREWYLVLRT